MARRKRRDEPRRVSSPLPSPSETQPRSIDTGQQMRDAFRVARADQARRFVEASIASSLARRRLEIEDLRRNRYERKEIPVETYRREDGRSAPIDARQVRNAGMLRQGMPAQVRYVFRDSRGTIVCQRRQIRRRVIFALQLSRKGKGSGRPFRPARWTERSYIVCRRMK